MNRFMFAAAVFLIAGLTISTVTLAMDDDPPAKPAQPKVIQGKAIQVQPKAVQVQPIQPGVGRVTATKMAQLEEEFETLEAHRDVKKAYVRAAEVTVKGAENTLELVNKPGVVAAVELMKAKLEVDAARAQLEIRIAELKEVEVKVKFAKKRLEDAKAGGPVPKPKLDP